MLFKLELTEKMVKRAPKYIFIGILLLLLLTVAFPRELGKTKQEIYSETSWERLYTDGTKDITSSVTYSYSTDYPWYIDVIKDSLLCFAMVLTGYGLIILWLNMILDASQESLKKYGLKLEYLGIEEEET